jgi:hypothetical protein
MRTFIFKNTSMSASLSVDAKDLKAARGLVATIVADTGDWAHQFDFDMEEGLDDAPYEDAMDHLSEDDFEEEDWDDEDEDYSDLSDTGYPVREDYDDGMGYN